MGEAKRRKELGLTHLDRPNVMSPEVKEVFDRFKEVRSGKYVKRSKNKNRSLEPVEQQILKYSADPEGLARMIFEPKRPMMEQTATVHPEAVYVGGDRGQRTLVVNAEYTTFSLVYHNSHGHDIYPECCMTAGPWYLPDRAQKIVTTVLGEADYLKWKALVKKDLGLLSEMIFSDEFTWKGTSFSAISCHRSKLLCESMGFEIHHWISFFFR